MIALESRNKLVKTLVGFLTTKMSPRPHLPRTHTTGVEALGERHMDQIKKEGEFTEELEQLRCLKKNQRTALADIQRETRANTCYFADLQVAGI